MTVPVLRRYGGLSDVYRLAMACISNKVLGALEERQMSRRDLADLSGITFPIIRRLTQPDSNPFLDNALTIARILEVPVTQLFWLESSGSR